MYTYIEYYTAVVMNEVTYRNMMNLKDRMLSKNNHSWENVYHTYFIKFKNRQ